MYSQTTWLNVGSTLTPLDSTNLNKAEKQYQYAVVIGQVKIWVGTTAPSDFLLCDGTQYNGASTTYSALFAVTSRLFGGSGNNFNVPNLKGQYVSGYSTNAGEYDTVGKVMGSSDVILTIAEIPSHSHSINAHSFGGNPEYLMGNGLGGLSTNTKYAGGGIGHENRPQTRVMNYIIRYR